VVVLFCSLSGPPLWSSSGEMASNRREDGVIASSGALGAGAKVEGEADNLQHIAMLWMFVAFMMGTITKTILRHLNKQHHIKFPYSVALLFLGGFLGYFEWSYNTVKKDGIPSPDDMWYMSQGRWSALSGEPTLLLFMFLPPLIYESAMSFNFFIFSSHAVGAMLLAGPGMLLQVLMIAAFLMGGLPYGWKLKESVMLGGILSATDPVAVVASIKDMGTMPDLAALIEGESILNDGTSIVVFELCYSLMFEPDTTKVQFFGRTLELVIGGPILGAFFFFASYYWLSRTNDAQEQTIVTVSSAYLCYFVAEATPVRASGVLAVFAQGILMAGYGRHAISADAEHTLHAFWSMLIQLSESLIFILAGSLIMNRAFLSKQDTFNNFWTDTGYIVLLYLVLLIIRASVVGLCGFYFRRYGMNLDPETCIFPDFVKKLFIVTWGGLRGAVGLALALSVNVDGRYRTYTADPLWSDRVLFYVSGVVFMTLMINATTLEFFVQFFGLNAESSAAKAVYKEAARYLLESYEDYLDELQRQHIHPEMISARWMWVQKLSDLGIEKTLRTKIALESDHPPEGEAAPDGRRLRRAQSRKVGPIRRLSESALAKINALNGTDGPVANLPPTPTPKSVPVVGLGAADSGRTAQEEPDGMSYRTIHHARFLMTLKVFYSVHFKKGLVSKRPFLALTHGVDQSLQYVGRFDHDPDSIKGFELEWVQGSLLNFMATRFRGVREWLEAKVDNSTILTAAAQFSTGLVKEMVEVYRSIIHAHGSTQQIVKMMMSGALACPENQQDCIIKVENLSKSIVKRAEECLKELEGDQARAILELSTERASVVLINAVQEDAKKLFEVGQITGNEWKKLSHRFEERLLMIKSHPPLRMSESMALELHNVPYYNIVEGERFFSFVHGLSGLERLTFEAGQMVLERNALSDGLWYVSNGSVRVQQWDTLRHFVGEQPVYLGGVIGEIAFMSLDVSKLQMRNGLDVIATTDCELVHVPAKEAMYILDEFPLIRQRLWQLHGKRFVQLNVSKFKRLVITDVENLNFSHSVMRRPAMGVKVKHQNNLLLLRGRVVHANGVNSSAFCFLHPDSDSSRQEDYLTMATDDVVILLFKEMNSATEYAHLAAVDMMDATPSRTSSGDSPMMMPEQSPELGSMASLREAKKAGGATSWSTAGIERKRSFFNAAKVLENLSRMASDEEAPTSGQIDRIGEEEEDDEDWEAPSTTMQSDDGDDRSVPSPFPSQKEGLSKGGSRESGPGSPFVADGKIGGNSIIPRLLPSPELSLQEGSPALQDAGAGVGWPEAGAAARKFPQSCIPSLPSLDMENEEIANETKSGLAESVCGGEGGQGGTEVVASAELVEEEAAAKVAGSAVLPGGDC